MFAGMALSVHLFVCVGLSLFIICGPYLSVVVCVFYAYNLTLLGGAEPHVCPDILGRCDRLLQDQGGTLGAPPRCVGAIHGARFEIEAVQM